VQSRFHHLSLGMVLILALATKNSMWIVTRLLRFNLDMSEMKRIVFSCQPSAVQPMLDAID
jgi:hypothetical protein